MIFPVIFDTSVISAPDSKLSEEWSSFGSRFCHFCPIAALSAPASVIFVISAPPLASPRCAAGEVVCGLMGRIVAMNPCSCQGGTVIVGCILRVVGVGGVHSECRRFGFFDSASLRYKNDGWGRFAALRRHILQRISWIPTRAIPTTRLWSQRVPSRIA